MTAATPPTSGQREGGRECEREKPEQGAWGDGGFTGTEYRSSLGAANGGMASRVQWQPPSRPRGPHPALETTA